MADDLLARARSGDEGAFAQLTRPHERELLVHCYRMLGSFQDAEDAMQETMVSAWRGLDGFRGGSSVRTWLYRIATNRCLNVRRAASRRPVKAWDIPGVDPPPPTLVGEVTWLEPYPDALLDDAAHRLGPEGRYEQRESISLAFITALQLLPPRQVAVLVLRDVLGFPASEVAEMLDATVDSVNSALKRARTGLQRRSASVRGAGGAPAVGSDAEHLVVDRFVRAWEAADLDALVGLLADDVHLSMPPIPFEYEGLAVAADFFARIFAAGRRFDLVPTRANGQPAFGAYLQGPSGTSRPVGLYVLALDGASITAMTRFEPGALTPFRLPATMRRR